MRESSDPDWYDAEMFREGDGDAVKRVWKRNVEFEGSAGRAAAPGQPPPDPPPPHVHSPHLLADALSRQPGAPAAQVAAIHHGGPNEGDGLEMRPSGGAASSMFDCEHLAKVVSAALSTRVAMKDFVSALKAKNLEAFKSVQLSSKGVAFSNEQIAARITACRPGQVKTSQELLTWLLQSKIMSRKNLQDALNVVGIKHVSRDTVEALCEKIISEWPSLKDHGADADVGAADADVGAAEGEALELGGRSGNRGASELEQVDRESSMQEALSQKAVSEGAKTQQDGQAEDDVMIVESPGKSSKQDAPCSSQADSEDCVRSSCFLPDEKMVSGPENATLPADRSFGPEQLALALSAGFSTRAGMETLGRELKAHRTQAGAFRGLQFTAGGARLSKEQIAVRIAECRPCGVGGGEELLAWLTKVSVVRASRGA